MFLFKCSCGVEFSGKKSNQRSKHLKGHGHYLEYKCLHCPRHASSKRIYELLDHVRASHFDEEDTLIAVVRDVKTNEPVYETTVFRDEKGDRQFPSDGVYLKRRSQPSQPQHSPKRARSSTDTPDRRLPVGRKDHSSGWSRALRTTPGSRSSQSSDWRTSASRPADQPRTTSRPADQPRTTSRLADHSRTIPRTASVDVAGPSSSGLMARTESSGKLLDISSTCGVSVQDLQTSLEVFKKCQGNLCFQELVRGSKVSSESQTTLEVKSKKSQTFQGKTAEAATQHSAVGGPLVATENVGIQARMGTTFCPQPNGDVILYTDAGLQYINGPFWHM